MSRILRLGRQMQAVQRDQAGRHIDDTLQRIGQNPHRIRQEERDELAGHQRHRDDDHLRLHPLFYPIHCLHTDKYTKKGLPPPRLAGCETDGSDRPVVFYMKKTEKYPLL